PLPLISGNQKRCWKPRTCRKSIPLAAVMSSNQGGPEGGEPFVVAGAPVGLAGFEHAARQAAARRRPERRLIVPPRAPWRAPSRAGGREPCAGAPSTGCALP